MISSDSSSAWHHNLSHSEIQIFDQLMKLWCLLGLSHTTGVTGFPSYSSFSCCTQNILLSILYTVCLCRLNFSCYGMNFDGLWGRGGKDTEREREYMPTLINPVCSGFAGVPSWNLLLSVASLVLYICVLMSMCWCVCVRVHTALCILLCKDGYKNLLMDHALH